jgi:hypothetical protein
MAYVSNVLTHWVGRGKPCDDQYNILTQLILRRKELLFGSSPWNFRSKYGGVTQFQISMISFSDIPFSESSKHCSKYSRFGLSFEKHYLANCLTSPVGYVQNPFVHENFSYIITHLQGMKGLLNGTEIPDGKAKGEKFDVEKLLSRFQYMMCFLEDHSKVEFIYNEAKPEPFPGQEGFFQDPSSLYYEREWRMVPSTTGMNLPWLQTRDGKTYFGFDERYLKWVIVPKAYLPRFHQEWASIFSDYRLGHIPSVVAYEDLEYI